MELFVDGACHGNPGPGGWAVVFGDSAERAEAISGGTALTTNNRMELTAALAALQAAERVGARPGAICIVTDSQYVCRGAQEWLPRWKAKGWKTAAGRPVANRDLWEELDACLQTWRPTWRWVRGHTGQCSAHTRADQLAGARAQEHARVFGAL